MQKDREARGLGISIHQATTVTLTMSAIAILLRLIIHHMVARLMYSLRVMFEHFNRANQGLLPTLGFRDLCIFI